MEKQTGKQRLQRAVLQLYMMYQAAFSPVWLTRRRGWQYAQRSCTMPTHFLAGVTNHVQVEVLG